MTTKIEYKPSEEFVTMLHPDSAAAEAFRTLRTNLSLRNFDKELKLINVISSTSKESKSTVTINLGYVYSNLNKKVLVIDMDLRLPSLHKKLRLKNKLGVTNVVARQCSFDEAVVKYAKNFDVLLAGTKTPYASEFVQSNTYSSFLNLCKENYDVVILDCPPINLVTDGMIVSTYCDGTIMCVGTNRVERKELEKARDLLKQFDVNVIGMVMTRVPVSRKHYGYEYGNYGYGGYGYGGHAYGQTSDQNKKHFLKIKKK